MSGAIRSVARAVCPPRVRHWVKGRLDSVARLVRYPPGADPRRCGYDAYWEAKRGGGMGRLSSWQRRRAEIFGRVMAPGDRVLDVGAGDGAILEYLIAERRIAGEGVDVSEAAVASCRARGLAVNLADVTRGDGVPDGHWDWIVFSEILEHLPQPERLVDAARRRAGKGLLVSVPNSGYITHRLRLLLGRFPLQWVVHPGEHLRFWTLADFAWWASAMDLAIVAVHPYEGVRLLRRWWPSLFAAGVVYELRDRGPRTP